jgi:hypothetical protein
MKRKERFQSYVIYNEHSAEEAIANRSELMAALKVYVGDDALM